MEENKVQIMRRHMCAEIRKVSVNKMLILCKLIYQIDIKPIERHLGLFHFILVWGHFLGRERTRETDAEVFS